MRHFKKFKDTQLMIKNFNFDEKKTYVKNRFKIKLLVLKTNIYRVEIDCYCVSLKDFFMHVVKEKDSSKKAIKEQKEELDKILEYLLSNNIKGFNSEDKINSVIPLISNSKIMYFSENSGHWSMLTDDSGYIEEKRDYNQVEVTEEGIKKEFDIECKNLIENMLTEYYEIFTNRESIIRTAKF